MIETATVRDIWEIVRPAGDAAQVLSGLDIDLGELELLEDKWNSETLPYLQGLKIEGHVQKEVDRLIKFAQDRIRQATEEYESGNKPFAVRRVLMEQRIPVAEKCLKEYQNWRQKTPSIKWEPLDVVDLKRMGVERFVRHNVERFYS